MIRLVQLLKSQRWQGYSQGKSSTGMFRADRKAGSTIGRRCIYLLLAFVLIGMGGCEGCGGGDSSDDTATPENLDLSGDWSFTITVTEASGVCSSEVGYESTRTITITQTGTDVTLDGFLGVPGNHVSGTLKNEGTGTTLEATGGYDEDGGETVSTHILTIKSANEMSGVENWSWDNHVNFCAGKATVEATRIMPTP
jgi:hypothetical protein